MHIKQNNVNKTLAKRIETNEMPQDAASHQVQQCLLPLRPLWASELTLKSYSATTYNEWESCATR